MDKGLRTFQLIHGGEIISPLLTTTREYGNWFEGVFDEYTTASELYMRSKKNGKTVLESHPGTRIGNFFDKQTKLENSNLYSWFILQDTKMMDTIVKYKLAEKRDAVPISVNDEKHRNMIRVYTVEQVEYYIRANIDRRFNMSKYLQIAPKKVTVPDSEMDGLIRPKTKSRRMKLF